MLGVSNLVRGGQRFDARRQRFDARSQQFDARGQQFDARSQQFDAWGSAKRCVGVSNLKLGGQRFDARGKKMMHRVNPVTQRFISESQQTNFRKSEVSSENR